MAQRFYARTPLKHLVDGHERIIPPGKAVPAELVDVALLAIASIAAVDDEELFHSEEGEIEGADGKPVKPLGRMTKPELLQVAADESVEVAPEATNPAIVAAIEAKRAAAGQA